MRRGRRNRSNRWLIIGLLAANAVVALVVGSIWWSDEEPPPLPAAPVAVTPTERNRIDWSRRFAPDADADATCERCNVLLIALDIFRPDHLRCRGYMHDAAPNICEMMGQGVVFDTFMAHAYQTPIAQMADFTGRYPSRSGFVSFASQLDPSVPTLPEAMQQAGYRTVAMGSSFEVMSDMSASDGNRVPFVREGLHPAMSFGRGFDRFVYTGHRNLPTDAIPWLQAQQDEPWFLWLVFGTLHWPYGVSVPPDLKDRFDPPGYHGILREELPLGFQVLSHIIDDELRYHDGTRKPLTESDHAFVRARYDVGLWYTDLFIGELVDSMTEEQLQSTLIVLYGIHGEDLGEHGYYGHYDVFDVETRMSMVVLDPSLRSEPRTVSAVTEGVDLAPTVLDLVGLPPLPDTDGRSLKGAIETGRADPERVAILERVPLWEDIFRHKSGMPEEFVARVTERLDQGVWRDRAIRSADLKLIHRTARDVEAEVSWYGYLTGNPVSRPEWELYDLADDPLEQTNVYAQRASEPAVVRLRDQLLAWEASVD